MLGAPIFKALADYQSGTRMPRLRRLRFCNFNDPVIYFDNNLIEIRAMLQVCLLSLFYLSPSFIIHHSSFINHHSSFIIHHSSFIIHHSSFINRFIERIDMNGMGERFKAQASKCFSNAQTQTHPSKSC